MNFFNHLVGRVDGPMSFRVYLQPLMATAFAIRDGRRDAREGRAPYGWALLSDPQQRPGLLRDGWKGISKVFVVAYVLDLVYQHIVLGGWHPGQAFATAIILALVPYSLLRGVANRLTPKGASSG